MIHHWSWIVCANNTPCSLLSGHWCCPGLIDELVRKLCKLWQIFPDVGSTWVGFLAKGNGRVNPEVLMEEGRGRKPHPVSSIKRPVSIKKQLLKDLHTLLPRLPEIAPGEEASHTVPCQVVDPALRLQLSHDCISPWKASPGLGPRRQLLRVGFPGDLPAHSVAHHF